MKVYKGHTLLVAAMVGVVLALGGLAVPAGAQNITPPDLGVCDGVEACDAPENVCKAGFDVTLTGFTPAAQSNTGKATYTYEICEPAAGTCSGDNTRSCLDNGDCTQHNAGTCSRKCAVDDFHGLSHFDVAFPLLADISCLSANNEVTGTCVCKTGSSQTCSVDSSITIGDGSCFANTCNVTSTGTCSGSPTICSNTGASCHNATESNVGTCAQPGDSCQTNGNCGPTPVAKCDNTNLLPGDCVVMTLEIAGETSGLGKGATVVVDKEATVCTSACMQGPSCDACDEGDGEACLTRTIGFWGTHPWITNNYVPVSVCGKSLTCDGADDGKSNPSCVVGTCNDVEEGLGSIPSELSTNQPYVSMIKQLTAAKLNLSATAALTGGAGQCSDFSYQGMSITQWITTCENLCNANKSTISSSGCIEALNAFNNSQDVGFAQTPAPFDRPSVDDAGNVSGADPSYFRAAKGPPKLVIGKNIGSNMCQ
ncbi:MAG: hypothetical protein ACREC3_02325 [Methyloceanibacter sp.]